MVAARKKIMHRVLLVVSLVLPQVTECLVSHVDLVVSSLQRHHRSQSLPELPLISLAKPHRGSQCFYATLGENEYDRSKDSEPESGFSVKDSFSSSRRDCWNRLFMAAVSASTLTGRPLVANALVKGSAPPPKSSKSVGDRPKCTNVEECQAMAELREQELREAAVSNSESDPILTTAKGTRYRDIGTSNNENAKIARDGDDVKVYYKVLKLGKRSYDGISGEGTVVFSRGYGLEDDEKRPGDQTFIATVGGYNNILAFNDAVIGMKEGSLRRFSIAPQAGWRKPGRACDGGPGGQGSGGDVKTDFVVVPTAQLVQEEACFDQTKQPFPTSYAQQRRMAQRFDQSLIMEVELVSVAPGGTMYDTSY